MSQRLIVIYSHGKSGTTSIYRSLESQTERTVIRFHMLNPSKVRAKVAKRESQGLKLGRSLRNSRRFVDDPSLLEGAQILTMIRDPIASSVSSFFYRLAKNDDNKLRSCIESNDPAPLLLEYNADFETIARMYLNWFDSEIGTTLGLNIYDLPFNKSQGFQVYQKGRWDLLVSKLERDDRVLENAIRTFLSIPNFRLTRRNVSHEKPYAELYKSFRQRLALAPDLIQRIYSHHSVRHFYTEDEIDLFVQQWGTSS